MTKRYVWIDHRLLNIVAFGGKGSEAPAAPDFTPIAQADAAAAQSNLQLGREQLDWGRQQFDRTWPYAQQYLQSQIVGQQEEQNAGGYAQNVYEQQYVPAEENLVHEAETYNSPERATARAGSAMADVTNAFAGQRSAALNQLESYGIDPSQTRFGALDLGTRVQEAAATAAAGTQSRLNSEATGLALQGDVVNIGRGYPGAVASSYSTATGAGSAGLSSANQTSQTGGALMGTPTQYGALANNAYSNQASALGTGYGLQLQRTQMNNQLAGNQAQGIGSLIGGAGAIGALFL
jgi:hypothetical protein